MTWQQDDMFPEAMSEEAQAEAMYQQAIRVPLEQKIEMAIGLIQTFEKQALTFSEDGYYVCFSGGKDSIVMAKLFEMAGVKFTLNYSNVTIDPPELVRFIKRQYPQTIWHNPEQHLMNYMVRKGKGPPTRMNRWCCEIYKEQGGAGRSIATGVRASESKRRKGLWRTLTTHAKHKTPILCPILYWTDDNVWSFIQQNSMKYCSLYDEGWKRLGCIGCPLGARQKQELLRWPKYEKMWRSALNRTWQKWKDVPNTKTGQPRWWAKFKSGDEVWDWWMEEKNVNDTDEPDCQLYLW